MCLSGGAPLPLEIKARFEALTRCTIIEGYGLSETAPVATSSPLDGPHRPGSIGLPLPATRISLRDLTDPAREVGPGEQGEICVAGPQVMLGYWQRPEETRNAFVDGYFRTGDVARMDADGFLYIEDRIKDLIICSGYKVYPRQVEEALYAHPAVEEATVIGVPDAYRGEAPKAFVKLKPGSAGTTAETLLAHCASKLSRHEQPASIEFRDALPKTMIGKLSKKELKAEEAARRAAN
jgi:long-chain acyl-CoA synthetase